MCPLNSEPTLTPPENQTLTRIMEKVRDMKESELAYEIVDRELQSRVHDIIFETELQDCLLIVQELVIHSDMEKLLNFLQPDTLEKVREMLVDYLYWKNHE